jgi:hypothetical protein
MNQLTFTLALALAATSLTGCLESIEPDYGSLGLVSVSGTITLDGDPLSNTVVFFESPDETFSYATTDSNGYYTLKFNSKKEGVIPGQKVVRISTTASTGESAGSMSGMEEDDGEGDEGEEGGLSKEERVPTVYNKESQLNVTVPDSSTTFDFDLKSDGSTTGPS